MHLSWYGESCFKLVTKEATVIVDPFDRAATGLEPPRSKADVVVFTHKHADHGGASYKQADFSIHGPGEYEVKGVHFSGFPVPHDDEGGNRLGFSAAFILEADDLRVLHLGDLGTPKLTTEQLEEIGDVDILLIPVGGHVTLNADQAERLVRAVEPKVVIPMHYAVPKLKLKLDGVEPFLKEMGATKVEPLPKYVVKKKDLPESGPIQVVVLDLATGD